VRLGVADVDDEEHARAIIPLIVLKLYAVPGSHPCLAVEHALRLKSLPYRRIDLPQGMHVVAQRLRFGQRTVPGLLGDGVKAVGSRPIMRELDRIAPAPALLPSDPEARRCVLDAERWGDEVLQAGVRRLAWAIIPHAGAAGLSYLEDSNLPFQLPAAIGVPVTRLITPVERRINGVTDDVSRQDVRAVPSWLDEVDRLIADGVIGGEAINAADLQVGSSVRLLLTYDDLAPLAEDRPAAEHARRIFPDYPGHVPAGALPEKLRA
jgi:glutathione S-transferase